MILNDSEGSYKTLSVDLNGHSFWVGYIPKRLIVELPYFKDVEIRP